MFNPWGVPPIQYNPNTSILAGMTTAQLQQALGNAQAALVQLQTGAKVVSVSYAQGDGSRSVSYTAANAAGLTQFIMQLQQQLGIPGVRRRALRPIF
ncbi:phage head-tail adapter protein [Gluconacetobacter diazotrophicus]|uniref:Phage head-tail adapter protein n=1 Tax=Gluconacetobacter diazotrophicus TaxID=33996 RepID=A0A7W4I6K4_GLUDI|nr:gpW family head-tail joining protein [Gluconacetobacter diazotrophicus]MBB2157210.1 phage head-tail adapter protein [Gluconacetobacter diazotrophicus]